MRVFRCEVSVLIEKNPEKKRQEPWTERVAESSWSHSDNGTAAPPLILQVPTMQSTQARLVIDEDNNRSIPIESARLLLPARRLRFFCETGADLTLYYGRPDLETPAYDVAALAPLLMGAAPDEITFSPENFSVYVRRGSRLFQSRSFWVILISGVAALALLVARRIKAGKSRG